MIYSFNIKKECVAVTTKRTTGNVNKNIFSSGYHFSKLKSTAGGKLTRLRPKLKFLPLKKKKSKTTVIN